MFFARPVFVFVLSVFVVVSRKSWALLGLLFGSAKIISSRSLWFLSRAPLLEVLQISFYESRISFAIDMSTSRMFSSHACCRLALWFAAMCFFFVFTAILFLRAFLFSGEFRSVFLYVRWTLLLSWHILRSTVAFEYLCRRLWISCPNVRYLWGLAQ